MQMMGITFELKVKEFYIHNLLFDGWTQGMLIEKFIMWWSSNISRGSASKREKREYCMPFNSNTDWCRLCHTNWSNYHAWFMNHVYFFRKLKVCHSTMLRKQDKKDLTPNQSEPTFFSTKKNSKYLMMTEAFLVSLSYMISQEVCRCHSFLTHSSGLFFWVISTSQLFDVLIVSWHTLQLISVNHYLLPNCLKSIFIRVISDIKADNLWWWKDINL